MEFKQIYQAILENMNGEVYVRDLDKNLLYINPASEKLTGWSFEEAAEKKCYEVFGDEELKCIEVCPVDKAISQKLHVLHHEGKLKTRSGDVKDMQVSISPFYDKENIVGAVVVMEDISRLREVEQTNIKTLIALEKEIEIRKQAEEALRKSEERFSGFAKASGYGLAMGKLSGQLVFGNSATLRIVEEEPEADFTAKTFYQYYTEEDKQILKTEILPTVMAKGQWIGEIPLLTAKGNLTPTEQNIFLISDRHGAPQMLGNIITDITERKQAEKKLEREKIFSERLIASSVDGILAFDQNCNYTLWNPGMERISGKKSEDIIGKHAFDIFPFLKETGEDKFFFDALAGKTAVAKDRPYYIEDTRQKGFFEGYYSPIRDESDEVIGGLGVIRDITARKQVEETLRESEEKYRQLFEMESDAIFLVRQNDGQILEVNTAGTEFYGYTREELLKMTNIDLSAEPDATQKATLEPKREIPLRYHRKKNGTVFPVEITANQFIWQGQEVLIAAIRDIANRKQAEEEREKLINELQKALKEIKTLRGILPLCSFCKKIRDDKGYWEKVDVYIHKHSEADISHSICPECAKEHYPDLDIYDD